MRKFQEQYVVDAKGQKTTVIISLAFDALRDYLF
jgi:hypothetical protein